MLRFLFPSTLLTLAALSLTSSLPVAALVQSESPARTLVTQGLDLVGQHYRGLKQLDRDQLRQRTLAQLETACQGKSDCDFKTGGRVLDAALATLGDGHTYRLDPTRYAEYRADARNQVRSMLGLKLVALPDSAALIVTRVKRGSPASGAGVARGDVLWAVDGRSLESFPDASAAQEFITGRELEGKPMRLTLSTRRDPRRVTVVQPQALEPWTPIYTLRPDGVAFITFYQFVTVGQIASRVQALMSQVREDNARAVIVDLRGSGGGAASETYGSIDAFLNLTSFKFQTPEPSVQRFDAPSFRRLTSTTWPGKILVLTNHISRSAAEYLAAGLQPSSRVTVIGEPTAGVLNSSTALYELIDGGALAITAAASANRPERVTPAVLQTDDMAVLSRGRDLILEQALKILKQP